MALHEGERPADGGHRRHAAVLSYAAHGPGGQFNREIEISIDFAIDFSIEFFSTTQHQKKLIWKLNWSQLIFQFLFWIASLGRGMVEYRMSSSMFPSSLEAAELLLTGER